MLINALFWAQSCLIFSFYTFLESKMYEAQGNNLL